MINLPHLTCQLTPLNRASEIDKRLGTGSGNHTYNCRRVSTSSCEQTRNPTRFRCSRTNPFLARLSDQHALERGINRPNRSFLAKKERAANSAVWPVLDESRQLKVRAISCQLSLNCHLQIRTAELENKMLYSPNDVLKAAEINSEIQEVYLQ